MPYVSDPDFDLHVGDVRDVLRELEPESVHCVVTSPPYWGLRDYGTGEWEAPMSEGSEKPRQAAPGDTAAPGLPSEIDWRTCDHIARDESRLEAIDRNSTLRRGGQHANLEYKRQMYSHTCGKCGARRVDRQLGLEPTPEEYIANMVEVFREVRRVLRADGTCWLNLGDSYAGGGGFAPNAPINQRRAVEGSGGDGKFRFSARVQERQPEGKPKGIQYPGLKPKDLVGIPWRVAFALQADGWYLRSDIIWSKPNPMPESVTDRPTKAHEYIFLLTKSPRYFFDQEAVREPHTDPGQYPANGRKGTGSQRHEQRQALGKLAGGHSYSTAYLNPAGRNIRTVWEIATQPYPEAHFATFPQALVEPCIKAGCPEGGTVCDPFIGSGTTALVARRLGRKCIGIELNPTYAELAAKRLQQLSLLAEPVAQEPPLQRHKGLTGGAYSPPGQSPHSNAR